MNDFDKTKEDLIRELRQAKKDLAELRKEKTTKLLPHDKEIEQVVLGSVLVDNTALHFVGQYPTEIFWGKPHQIIFEAIKKLLKEKKPVDIVTVTDKLKSMRQLDEVGGAYYITQLTDMVSSTASHKYYTSLLYSKYLLREVIKKNSVIREEAYAPDGKISNISNMLRETLLMLSTTTKEGGIITPQTIKKYRMEGLKTRRNTNRILTGYPTFDKRLSEGFVFPYVTILAGPTSGGKTATKNNWSIKQLEEGWAILSFVPEMGFMGEMDRIQTITTGIPLRDIKNIRYWEKKDPRAISLKENLEYIEANWKFYLDGMRGQSLQGIFNKILDLKNQVGQLDIIYIDTFKKIPDVTKAQKDQNEISEILHQIEAFAEEAQVHFILLNQFNRDIIRRSRSKHIPAIGDIEFGSAHEHSAHNIIAVERNRTWDHESVDDTIRWWILKQRDGEAGGPPTELLWNGATTTITDPTLAEPKKTSMDKITLNLEELQ